MSIDVFEAEKIASQRVAEIGRDAGDEFQLLPDATIRVDRGWLFFYNSSDFVRTKNPIYAIAGNGPLLVTLNGVVVELPSSVPWEVTLSSLPEPLESLKKK